MMSANSGYSGWSMSNRAVEAYENGERPKSRWTKRAMLEEIAAYVDEYGVDMGDEAMAYLATLTRDELFRRFFILSSWHHTSKFFNATDFYSLEEMSVDEYAERPTRRVYEVHYMLGRSRMESRHTFATHARAERHLERLGFERSKYAWYRKLFMASIRFHTEDI